MHGQSSTTNVTWFVDAADARLWACVNRLHRPDYDPAAVLSTSVSNEWPGDLAGRLILALSHLDRVSHACGPRLAELVAALPKYLNNDGYFGQLSRAPFDEQQLAGHGWLVSGLLTHAHDAGDSDAREMALRIVENLMLPALSQLGSYPRTRTGAGAGAGTASGEAIGSLAHTDDTWAISTDTYCVFITLEGLVPAFAATADPAVGSAIDALLDLLGDLDLRGTKAQLHASLTAARRCLDYWRLTGNDGALTLARTIYDEYAQHARTVNYATWNWFQRPDAWTEPCGIVDSALLALGLWRATGETRYLDDAHAIEHSGLGHAQKHNGGFALDRTAWRRDPWLSYIGPEATWCCTMRGATGLSQLRQLSCHASDAEDASHEPEHVVDVDLFRSGLATVTFTDGVRLVIRQTTSYPASGDVRIEIVEASSLVSVALRCSIPGWARRDGLRTTVLGHARVDPARPGSVTLDTPRPGDGLAVGIPFDLRTECVADSANDPGAYALFSGPSLLGREVGDAGSAAVALSSADIESGALRAGQYAIGGWPFQPVWRVFDNPSPERYRSQVLFEVPTSTE